MYVHNNETYDYKVILSSDPYLLFQQPIQRLKFHCLALQVLLVSTPKCLE